MPRSDEEYIECVKNDTLQQIIYCKYLNQLDKCMNPKQKEYTECHYKKLSDCPIAEPDEKEQESYIKDGLDSKHFWEDYKKKDSARKHICDFTIEELKQKHANALKLIPAQDRISIGLLIAGKYYNNVWNSRSCSAHLSELVGGKDYLDFYCSSSNYYFLMKLIKPPIVELFNQADKKDN